MRKLGKIVTTYLLAICFVFNMATTAFASTLNGIQARIIDRVTASQEVKNIIGELITLYSEGYRVDVIGHLEKLKVTSPEYYEIWNSVIEYWDWIESDMIENIGVAPDGIENPDKHAFIVLGFALNEDGTMTDELIGRLEVAKASALKYPESYVLVTGGVEKNGWTEGRRMRDWLVANGIDESRIIVEEAAPDTAGNATNSFQMLYNDYDVDSVSLITSQYHLKRGSLLYYAESLLKAEELGVEPIEFIGEANAGWYREDKTYEPLSLKALSLRLIGRVDTIEVSDIVAGLNGIKVTGKTEYVQGEELDIKVTSIDNNNYNVDLTDYVTVKGFDTETIGEQNVEVSYIERGTTYKTIFNVNVSEPEKINRDTATQKVKDIIGELITFYSEGYRVDVIEHLEQLKVASPKYHEIWNSVIEYWDWIESDMIENIGVAPDGIENPEKHAFIVLGFALNEDGTMTDELIGRLEVAKASALKYPESYVLVTGGVEKNGWTEGRRMRDWLVANGIDESRIIVEEAAPDTAGNATNSFEMLYKDYDVDSVSLITSQYHLKRGSLLYYAESLLKAAELGVEPIEFIGNANAGWYREDKTYEPLSLKALSLRLIGRVGTIEVSDIAAVIEGIKVTGKTEYVQGEELDITVTSIDDMNYNVDLTEYVTVEGFDANVIGEQKVEVSYVQRDTTYTEIFTVNVSEAVADEETDTETDTETDADTEVDTETDTDTESDTNNKNEENSDLVATSDSNNMGVLAVALMASLVGIAVLTYRKKQAV
ncbi:YdcF family protein [Clostridium sp. AL.422]|uniref:YdcF family protein n=1 Tax=Clostridium TaxID=1485 RepID=UPI00293DEDEA|nr:MULTISPECIES: YdcF family protein [unclassified Clostridium]MDV4150423.1 YdcF family protein [Clostridium sp. AL.422]